MTAPREVIDLIERFEQNRESYRSSQYNETETRREFIDPFFKALGWDIDNEQGYAEAYKDVVHEDAIKIGGATKAPDYAFRIGGARKFFVEAKRPGMNIKGDGESAMLQEGQETLPDDIGRRDTIIPIPCCLAKAAALFGSKLNSLMKELNEVLVS